MTFKSGLAEDLKVFVDVDEYGEEVELDGVRLNAVIMKSTGNRQRAGTSTRNRTNPELHNMILIGRQMTIYFRAEEYRAARKKLPKYGEFIELNGKRYKVEESQEDAGLMRLSCAIDVMNKPRMEIYE